MAYLKRVQKKHGSWTDSASCQDNDDNECPSPLSITLLCPERPESDMPNNEALRDLFVRTALSHVGKGYDELDCCGLVRKCVSQLRRHFRFTLTNCNQGIIYETLEGYSIQRKDLKPGDLIFYSAKYTDQNRFPKRNGMVHVEIYVGPGDKTIASRGDGWKYSGSGYDEDLAPIPIETDRFVDVGKVGVQEYVSYKCFSSKWRDPVICYYRSIEPWLAGLCKKPPNMMQDELRRQEMGRYGFDGRLLKPPTRPLSKRSRGSLRTKKKKNKKKKKKEAKT